MLRLFVIALVASSLAACGGDDRSCDPVAQTGCAAAQVCAPVQGGIPACLAPVIVQGTVSDIANEAPLNGARVVALDANRAPLSTVSVTAGAGGSAGVYELAVLATRDAKSNPPGAPVQAFVTLRADAQGYQTFPGGVRSALPIDLSSATFDSASATWKITTLTTPLAALKLIPLEPAVAAANAAYVHGSVARPTSGAGALVVAEPAPGGTGPGTGISGIADRDGSYAIFNLTPGTQYVVTAYTKGANYTPVTTAALTSGDHAVAAIALGAGAGVGFDGGLIYNNAAATSTAVSLVVASTYDLNLDRGESPPGLTVAGTSSYAFAGVPDGDYRVLAAFDVDGDVRDVSGAGNTTSPLVAIQGGAVVGSVPNFKIIPAVDLLTIDGTSVSATAVKVATATPTFAWQSGSVDVSANLYRVKVYDSLGTEIWSQDQGAINGQNSIAYAGPALEPGMYYQLRILAISVKTSPSYSEAQLSQTEDLLGVFTY